MRFVLILLSIMSIAGSTQAFAKGPAKASESFARELADLHLLRDY